MYKVESGIRMFSYLIQFYKRVIYMGQVSLVDVKKSFHPVISLSDPWHFCQSCCLFHTNITCSYLFFIAHHVNLMNNFILILPYLVMSFIRYNLEKKSLLLQHRKIYWLSEYVSSIFLLMLITCILKSNHMMYTPTSENHTVTF